jgi:hypothetical protein
MGSATATDASTGEEGEGATRSRLISEYYIRLTVQISPCMQSALPEMKWLDFEARKIHSIRCCTAAVTRLRAARVRSLNAKKKKKST